MRIFHPTDLEPGGTIAFLHALRLASLTRSHLTIMHVSTDGELEWSDLPGVRGTLAKWGMVRNANDMEGLKDMGLSVRKVIADRRDPVRACLDHLEDHPADLVVLATHQREGAAAWFRRRVAEPIARRSGEPSLLVPHGRNGFLDAASGNVHVHRVLVPVTSDPSPLRALEVTRELLAAMDQREGVLTLLHVGSGDTDPKLAAEPPAGWTIERLVLEGDPVEVIVRTAKERACDLLVMSTKGHDGFLDVLRGNTTERVLRAVDSPVLAVPA